jgi:hypothetical protein
MKKVLLFLLFAFPSVGCDLCGCANSNAFLGLMPASNRGFMGVRYRYQNFTSHVTSPVLKTEESFQTTELWGRFYPINKVQVMAILPYAIHTQKQIAQQQSIQISGLADPTLFVHYSLLNTLLDSTMHEVNQSLLMGAGLKPALGKFRYEESNPNQVANANFQLGTGSTDWMLNALYNIRYAAWGINADAQYRFPGENPDSYRFGARSSVAMTLFYAYGRGHKITLMPYVNTTLEYAARDSHAGLSIENTGGGIQWLGAGLEAYSKRFVLGLNFAKPVAQNLSSGELQAIDRFSFHISYLF